MLWLPDSLFVFLLDSLSIYLCVSVCTLIISLCLGIQNAFLPLIPCLVFVYFCMVGMGGNINRRMKATRNLRSKALLPFSLNISQCRQLSQVLVGCASSGRDGFGRSKTRASLVGACEMSRVGCGLHHDNDDHCGLELPKLKPPHVSPYFCACCP